MKLIIYTFLFLLSSNLQSQVSNFNVGNGDNIEYVKIFDLESLTKDDLINYLETISNLKISSKEEDIVGSLKDLKINFKKYGKGSFPIFLRYSLSSDVRIQLKDSRFRLIITNIGFLDDVSLYSTSTFKESDNFTYLTEFYVKNNGELRSGKMVERTLDVMDKHFTELFTPKKLNDDW